MASSELLFDKKYQKKIRKFISPTETAANKISVIYYFTCNKCQDEETKDKVYSTFCKEILTVLMENYDAYVGQLKLKGKSHESEVVQYLEILRKLMNYNLISMRKTVDKFNLMLKHLLHIQNKANIRGGTFNLLLDMIQKEHDEELLNLLPYAIDLTPFAENINLAHPLDYQDIISLVPKEEHYATQNAEETIEYLKLFLELFRKVPDKFEYWFGIFKKYFVVSLYPKVAKDIGLSVPDNVGFVKLCPVKLQEVIVAALGECMMERKAQCAHLWSDTNGNAHLMLEMYRQGLRVPPGEVQKCLLDAYFKVLFIDPVDIPPERLQAHRKFFLDPLHLVVLGANTNTADFLELLLHLQRIFKHSVNLAWNNLDQEMKDKILMTCLKLATNLGKGDASPKEDSSMSALVELVLYMWVHTQVTSKAQWETLRHELGTILHRHEVVDKIQTKLLQVTYYLSTVYFYNWEKYNRNIDRILKSAKHSGYSRTPDGRKFEVKKWGELVVGEPWDADKLITIWFYLLDIFRLLNITGDGGKQTPISSAIHTDICRAMKRVIYSLLTAYEVSDKKPEPDANRPQVSLVQIFGPWLFETILDLPDEYLPGKAIAMKALCRIFCRHSQDRYPPNVLSRFFETIRIGLTKYSDTPISWAIIDTTVPIFALAFPGVNILVPYYLFEISRLLIREKHKNKPGPDPRVRERGLLILASLVSFPRHYQDMPSINIINDGHHDPTPSNNPPSIITTQSSDTSIAHEFIIIAPQQDDDRVEEGESDDSEYLDSEDIESEDDKFSILNAEEDEEDRHDEEWMERSRDAFQMFGSQLKYTDLQKILTRFLHFALKYDLNEPKHTHDALSILGVLLLEELYKENPDKRYIDMELHRILKQTLNSTNYLTALRTLQTFAIFYNKFDEYYIRHIIQYLCYNIIDNIKDPKLVKIIAEHYNTLLIWLCSAPPKFYDDRRIVRTIFTTIEIALAHERKKKKIDGSNETIPTIHQEIQVEAQKLLITLLNFVHNFPTNGHYDIISTQGLTDMDKDGVMFTSLNDLFVYSYYDIPKEGSPLPESPIEAIHQLVLAYLEPRTTGITPAHRRMTLYFQNFLRNKYTDGNYLLDLLADLIEYREANPINPAEWRTEALAIALRYPLDPAIYKELSPFLPTEASTSDFNSTSLDKLRTATEDFLINLYNEFKETDMFQSAKESIARFTTRDVTGAFSWDCQLIFDYPTVVSRNPESLQESVDSEEGQLPSPIAVTRNNSNNNTIDNIPPGPSTFEVEISLDPTTSDDILPNMDDDTKLLRSSTEGHIKKQDVDGKSFISDLGQLLDYLSETQTLKDPSVTQNPPSVQYAAFHPEIDNVLLKLQQQQEEDNALQELQKQQGLPQSVPATLPPPPITTGPFRKSRLFLSHTGCLSFSTRYNFKMISNDDSKFKRFIKEFDKVQGRTPIKVGLLYVANGQEEETEIFKNDNPSNLYKEFVQGLAAIVDLKKHSGYAAALDVHKDVGNNLPYYATPWVELAFHEPVRMPNVDREEHLVMKKRHVGNDLIHIIWSEHELDYQTTTIVSQFNAAHVIIYPLRNGLFRIQIAQKKNVSFFGPLIHNMVLRKELLPDLCRQTVIYANSSSRAYSGGTNFEGPYEQRIKKLGDVNQKWTLEQNYTYYVSKTF